MRPLRRPSRTWPTLPPSGGDGDDPEAPDDADVQGGRLGGGSGGRGRRGHRVRGRSSRQAAGDGPTDRDAEADRIGGRNRGRSRGAAAAPAAAPKRRTTRKASTAETDLIVASMQGARTRGQPTALEAVEAMVRGQAPPHAILLVGPDGVGKTTLALDLAAGLLCEADPDLRPCRACRACLMVERDGHPDLHRLGPAGPGRQVVIGGPEARYRGVRDLIGELTLMPVEGRARVAIVEGAERMNEDAQSALLKTLEEPPAGVVIVLCADQETRLLPTVRSRCARIRLGLVGSRDIEAIVADHDLADPPPRGPAWPPGRRATGSGPGLCPGTRSRPDPCRAEPRPARPDERGRGGPPGGRPWRDPARHRAGDGAGRIRTWSGVTPTDPAASQGRRRGRPMSRSRDGGGSHQTARTRPPTTVRRRSRRPNVAEPPRS